MKKLFFGAIVSAFALVASASSQTGISGLPPELLVARAAAAVATINFERSLEEQALRDLAAAMRQEPQNTKARALLDLIQKRREDRAKQSQERGQRELRQQQNQPQEQQAQQQQQQRSPQQREEERKATRKIAGHDQRNQISKEEAQQLLDALQQEDRRPTQRAPNRNPAQGPRW
jgi:Mg-chelatase subunit ChlI